MACLTTQSGSSLLDKRGLLKDKIRLYQNVKNSESFEEVYLKYLQQEEKGTICTAISPRNLEAVLSQTLQITTVGEYSGLVEPKKYYMNLEEVLKKQQNSTVIPQPIA